VRRAARMAGLILLLAAMRSAAAAAARLRRIAITRCRRCAMKWRARERAWNEIRTSISRSAVLPRISFVGSGAARVVAEFGTILASTPYPEPLYGRVRRASAATSWTAQTL